MNAKGKKLVALFLVFSLITLHGNLFAKERRGVELEIVKKGGQPKLKGTPWEKADIRGELIAVKKSSLLLIDSESGADVSVDVNEIKFIRIVKKSKVGIVGIFGLSVGIILGLASGSGSLLGMTTVQQKVLTLGTVFGVAGALIGVSIGKYENIQIEGESDLEIKVILAKLRTKARVPNFQ